MRGTVSHDLEEFLAQVSASAAQARADGVEITPQLTRQNLENLSAFIPHGPDIELVKDVTLVTPTHQINTRLYHPAPQQSLGVILHFHGGGHMCGSLDLYDPHCRELAQRTQSIVISIDYRLAPEHPYPSGIDDCQYALLHYHKLLDSINYDKHQLSISGDSAGGAICTSLVMKNIESPQVKINNQILIYPSVDYTLSTESFSSNGQGYLLEAAKVRWYFDAYFAQHKDDMAFKRNASPLFGSFSANMPKTLVVTAGCDPLRDEGLAYVEKVKQAGAMVSHHHFDGMIHAYMLLHNLVPQQCQETYEVISQFVDEIR